MTGNVKRTLVIPVDDLADWADSARDDHNSPEHDNRFVCDVQYFLEP